MAIAERPIQAPAGPVTYEGRGWGEWLSTVDHKKIGIMYMVSAFVFFVIGGVEALLMRVQLGIPGNTFLDPDVYYQLMTMHGTTMIFLGVMPMSVGLANYVVPIMVGARDMAFPRLNAMSIWLFILGALMLYVSFLAGGAANGGWFAYTPLTTKTYSPTHGMDYWILGLLLTGVASIAGAVNFIVTILNLRAPGMTLNRMPLFVWMMLITSFLMIFAFPSLTVAQIMLLFDRNFGTRFYDATQGGDPLMWQHLFWFFGHPEVYILILPAFGIISEILPTFARKPIFGYAFIAYSGVAIGFLGFLVWAHHMFAVGLGPLADAFFSGASFLIAIPTGVKILNWIGTLWGGSLNMKAPLYYAIGLIAMFLIGGISGITLASPPIDLQQTDSYYVVAHMHYVMFGGSVFGLLAGTYYWFPKITGRILGERLGKLQFWVLLIGFNLTFFPMHLAGTIGMPRRIHTYEAGIGLEWSNLLETIGAFGIALSFLIMAYNVIASLRAGEPATADPWDGATLEWGTESPPPVYNFARIPTVHSRRPMWDVKYPELEAAHIPGGPVKKRKDVVREQNLPQEPVDVSKIHLPSATYMPLILSIGLTILFFGILYLPTIEVGLPLAIVGLLVFAGGAIGWVGAAYRDSGHAH